MSKRLVGIIHYRMGNIASVAHAFDFLKIPVKIIEKPKELAYVSHIILPGVGAFGEGMKNLKEMGFVKVLHEQVEGRKKPFIGLCLGMQLLASTGYEGGKTAGLSFIAGEVVRLPQKNLRLPHVGWNNIKVVRENKIAKENVDVYFVHSYFLKPRNKNHAVATCDYGITFCAVVQSGNIFGTQFHPEKSHQGGLNILKNFASI